MDCFVSPDACTVCFCYDATATTDIYTLSLHDALPIWSLFGLAQALRAQGKSAEAADADARFARAWAGAKRSEEHTSELQSRQYLVCRLLLEKKNSPMVSGEVQKLAFIDESFECVSAVN